MSYRLDTDKTWNETYNAIVKTFDQWPGCTLLSIEPNVPLNRVNGRSFGPAEAAVTLRYKRGDQEVVLAYDRLDSPRNNLRALYLCLEDMRMIQRRGVEDLVRSAYLQLEGPRAPKHRDPYEVLGVRPDAPREVVEASYRALARQKHPDHGGSDEAMAELNEARAAVLGEATPA